MRNRIVVITFRDERPQKTYENADFRVDGVLIVITDKYGDNHAFPYDTVCCLTDKPSSTRG